MSDAMPQIKPCPFCNGISISVGNCWDVSGGYIRCTCGAMMQAIGEPLLAAIDKWNQRADNQPLNTSIIQNRKKPSSTKLQDVSDCQ